MNVEEQVPFARYTTIGTGGPARYLAQPSDAAELEAALAQARDLGLGVEAIGLGSNVLAHDDGVKAYILKLVGELASVRVEDDVLIAGGGAANAVCLHRARDAGLSGFEFASAIPGTVGGGVRMNAGAYGSDWAHTMLDAVVVSAEGVRRVTAADLDLQYRRSNLAPGEIVAEVRFRLTPGDPAAIKAKVTELLAQRKSTQPTNKRTFGSVFKNPGAGRGAGQLIEQAGLKGHRIGGAVISGRHANFIENAGGATSADAVALMVEARRRVHAATGVELIPEVRFLGPLELPPL